MAALGTGGFQVAWQEGREISTKREHTQAVAQESQGMTRRGFMGAALAGTMGVAAASLLAGCGAPAAEGAEGSTAMRLGIRKPMSW